MEIMNLPLIFGVRVERLLVMSEDKASCSLVLGGYTRPVMKNS